MIPIRIRDQNHAPARGAIAAERITLHMMIARRISRITSTGPLGDGGSVELEDRVDEADGRGAPMTRRRTPIGTQPPVAATEPAVEVAGVIEPRPDPALEAHKKALAAEENSVIVHIDDDWLERLDLPVD
jgi:hypothetical protein